MNHEIDMVVYHGQNHNFLKKNMVMSIEPLKPTFFEDGVDFGTVTN